MKIQCDVCNKKEAIVFCSADEAALCHGCDQGVHHANKLASKHHRFSLLHPPPSLAPLCDICKEKRALLFCQEDRAILCRDCELPLHTANEHTQKHNRFLLTGIKLSVGCDLGVSGCDPVPDFEPSRKPTSKISSLKPINMNPGSNITANSGNDQFVSGGSGSVISDYLIEMLPGWHFQDFEDASFGFQSGNMNEFEVGENVLSLWDADIGKKMSSSSSTNCSSIQSESLGIWVPEAPAAATMTTSVFGTNQPLLNSHNRSGLIQGTSVINGLKMSKKWQKDDAFTVPQITHPVGSKRPRAFW